MLDLIRIQICAQELFDTAFLEQMEEDQENKQTNFVWNPDPLSPNSIMWNNSYKEPMGTDFSVNCQKILKQHWIPFQIRKKLINSRSRARFDLTQLGFGIITIK